MGTGTTDPDPTGSRPVGDPSVHNGLALPRSPGRTEGTGRPAPASRTGTDVRHHERLVRPVRRVGQRYQSPAVPANSQPASGPLRDVAWITPTQPTPSFRSAWP